MPLAPCLPSPLTALGVRRLAPKPLPPPDYIARAIRDLKRFAKLYGVTVIVIAHPTKDVWHNGKVRVPTLYDIESSAHWHNKCDHGLAIERPNSESNEAIVHSAKVRFRGTGRKGMVRMMFDPYAERFEMLSDMRA